MTVSYDIYLTGDLTRFSNLTLVTADGETFRFSRISPGATWIGAVFRGDPPTDPRDHNPFAGGVVWWNGNGWTLYLHDGTTLRFPSVYGNVRRGQGSLLSIENRRGDLLRIDRDRQGNIRKLLSPHYAFIEVEHDARNRITKAIGSNGQIVTYQYDNDRRLARVIDNTAGATSDKYDQAGRIVGIFTPTGLEWIKIEYDHEGRVDELTFADGSLRRYEYEESADGLVNRVAILRSGQAPEHFTLATPWASPSR